MTSHCDRCGCVLEGEARPGKPRLCGACRTAALPSKRGGSGAWAAALLPAALCVWLGWRLVRLEGRLDALERRELERPAPRPAPAGPERIAPLALPEGAPEPERPSGEAPGPAPAVPDPVPEPAAAAPVEPPPDVPAAAAAPEPSAPRLPPELGSEDPLARAKALGALSDPAHAGAARALLTDDRGFVRRAAASALGRLKDASAVPGLVSMARGEKDLAARLEALRALRDITGIEWNQDEVFLAACAAWRPGGTP